MRLHYPIAIAIAIASLSRRPVGPERTGTERTGRFDKTTTRKPELPSGSSENHDLPAT